jgi:hypothetical protein
MIPQPRSSDRQRRNWILDAILFAGFLIASSLDLTGVGVHQWLGLAVAALAGVHLFLHQDWVSSVTRRFFSGTGSKARRYYMVDAGLLLGFATIALTGLVISTWLDLTLASYAAWRGWHVFATIVTLVLVVIKIGLHWRWIAGVARRSVPGSPLPAGASGSLAPAPARIGRREFLLTMGAVGISALVVGLNAVDGDPTAEASAAGESLASEATSSTASLVAAPVRSPRGSTSRSSSGTGASSCYVRCGRRCSYPGHCRRYVDANGNGRCDLGECLS